MTLPAAWPGSLAAGIILCALLSGALSSVLAWQAWQAGVPPDLRQEEALVAAQGLAQLICALLTLIWLPLGIRQVQYAGAADLSVGPVGSVLWWFVPVANLVMPAKAVAELRKAALDPGDWQAVGGSPLIASWWTCWILAGLAGVASWRATVSEEEELRQFAGGATFAADLLSAPAALLFALVVLQIGRHLQNLPEADRRPGSLAVEGGTAGR